MTSHAFVPCVSAAGLLVVGHCISTLLQQPLNADWLALAALVLLTGAFTIKIPSIPVRLSVSETFVFASVLLFGTCAGTITVALEILVVIAAGTGRKARDPLRILFNVSSATLSIWIAGHAFYATAGIAPLSTHEAPLNTVIVPLAVMATVYFLLNSGMVATAVAIQNAQPVLRMWRKNFLGLAFNYFGGASLAALFVLYTRTIDLSALGVIVPLLVISYLTFKTSFSRVEDATRHLEEIKRLYLSTIETLATAIDTKDQVTHGHIRRVQHVTLALARELGVQDQQQLQALQAAALLHDTGKLAIPEHILNKPGKLTHGEFERMKQHASVGAEILSSIDFPYPVVPIVRHHHENWDGTGYPDGLKGIQIPVGARILSVVDCFDALTSDRPYRPRMSNRDAVSILLQRRGSMYDPLVVDTFVTNLDKLLAHAAAEQLEPDAPRTPVLLVQTASDESPIVASPPTELNAVLDEALRNTAATVAVLFVSDRDRDRIFSVAVRTQGRSVPERISIPIGTGVSGWVAANGTPILNADPSLDFRGHPLLGGLVRSICVPVLIRGNVVGVISAYTDDPRGFSDDDRKFLQIAAASFESADLAGHLSGILRGREHFPGHPRTVH